MIKKGLAITLRLVLLASVVALGAGFCTAQTQKQSNTKSKNNMNSQSGATVPAPAGCQPGQMRCMNSKHRWEAAKRHSDHRAAEARKHQGEVKM